MLEDIRAILAPHYEIIEAVADGRALVEAALRLRPDLIVSDITMPLLNGVDAAVQIKKSVPSMKLIFVTMHASAAYIQAVFEAGGTGYILKSGIREELLEAARSVLNGRIYVGPSLPTELRERFQNDQTPATARLSDRAGVQDSAVHRLRKRPSWKLPAS